MKKIIVFVLASFLFSVSAQAQENPNQVNCFDYYKFGSVQVDVEATVASTVSGVPMTFQGKIKNANPYPVVGGSVYVKVFKKQSDEEKSHANGGFLVDQFTAKENISIGANTEQDITFDWQVPNYAVSGDYQIATFFISQKKFNLLGLSFTDDIVGNIFNFQISGEMESTVQWDKNDVMMNDKIFNFAAFIPKFSKDETVSIKTKLQNSTEEAQEIPVTWTLYSWDGQQEENIIDFKTETISLGAKETKELQYQVTDSSSPVYFIVAEADFKDSKSIMDMRFGREGVNKIRLNFPSVMSYPLKADQSSTIFSCLHNSGLSEKVENNKLILTLLDENQKEIHKYTYEGDVTGAMMGLKDDFTPNKDYQNFTLKAQLYTDGKLVDETEMKYNCNEINKEFCPKNTILPSITSEEGGNTSKTVLSVILALLVVSIIAIVIKKRKNNSQLS